VLYIEPILQVSMCISLNCTIAMVQFKEMHIETCSMGSMYITIIRALWPETVKSQFRSRAGPLFLDLINAEPYENVRSTCVSCQRHNFPSFPLIPSLRERYTPGLWFLPPHRPGISKEHQLRVAQDQKPFKKCQFPFPTGNFMCVKFLWCFFTCFLSHFLCSFQIYNF
jgi:hypothetical protein